MAAVLITFFDARVLFLERNKYIPLDKEQTFTRRLEEPRKRRNKASYARYQWSERDARYAAHRDYARSI